MTDHDLIFNFWVQFDGSYQEFCEAFLNVLGSGWYFNAPPGQVTPANSIGYGSCDIFIEPSDGEHPVMAGYSVFDVGSKAGLTFKRFEINYRIDFKLQSNYDTPKTRRQLREIGERLPGENVLFTYADRYTLGVRENGMWSHANVEDVPWFTRYIPKKAEQLNTEDKIALEKYRKYVWEHYSMFDDLLMLPFNFNAQNGMGFRRHDWVIEYEGSIDELYQLISKSVNELYWMQSRKDLDKCYFIIDYAKGDRRLALPILQPVSNFKEINEGFDGENKYIFSSVAVHYPDDEVLTNELNQSFDEMFQKTNLKIKLYSDLDALVKEYL